MTAVEVVDEKRVRTIRPRRRPRKPVRRTLIAIHRWSALILGIVLVIQTTSGAILLYHAELFRTQHASFYRHTEGPPVIDLEGAVALVRSEDPGFDAGWVGTDGGVFVVGNRDYTAAYAVDPGTGRLNEEVDLTGGVLGWLVNLHDCAFGCLRYSGALPMLNEQAPLIDITWAATILVVLGLLLVMLTVSGTIIWWPSLKRLSHGLRVRWRKGRFARDRDLHNVIGILAVPFLLMWGITGVTIEWPAAERVVLRAMGGEANEQTDDVYVPRPASLPRPVSISEATTVALREAPGRLAYLMLPSESTPYYRAAVAGAYSPYEHRAFYSGDVLVYINASDSSDIRSDTSHRRPLANTFYAKVFEPAHFGWLVNPWWRLVWLIFGLAPLALAITGLSTWLFRRNTRRRKRAPAPRSR
ncbi:PepSY-associated TM helix domain-containing protein [Nocardia transvalensis]|uniref:PepSY-associated TM helix domain-containing protein n=1 Tax=Nocardia transvalensis TaxID=37333 RepID=UPI0018944E86|nr:PepSY-associated TM helix domain-containing protein [Nocardia transvalensis]MBF6332046.1 PepSY domain-containing protein [Nocardia transvalensis]